MKNENNTNTVNEVVTKPPSRQVRRQMQRAKDKAGTRHLNESVMRKNQKRGAR